MTAAPWGRGAKYDGCPGCLTAAGKSYTGRGGEERYECKGWRQAPSGATKCVRPPVQVRWQVHGGRVQEKA